MLAGPLYEVLSKLGVTDAAGKVECLDRGATQIIRMSFKTPDDWPGDEKKLYSYEVECPSLVAKKECRNMWAHTVWEIYPLNVPFILNFLPWIINVLAARFLPRGTLELGWCMLDRGIPGCHQPGKLDGSGIFVSHSAALQANLIRTIIDHFKRNSGSIEVNCLLWILLVKAWSKKEWAKIDKTTVPYTIESLDEVSSHERKLAIQTVNFDEGQLIEIHLDNSRAGPLEQTVFSQISFRLPTYSFASEQKSGWFLYSLDNPVYHIARISFTLDTDFTPLVREGRSIHMCSSGNQIGLIKQHLCPDASLTPPSYDHLHANVYEVRIEFLRPTSNAKHRSDVLSHLALITMLTFLFGPGSLANTVRPSFIPEHYPNLKSTSPKIVYDEYAEMTGLFDGSKGDQSQDYISVYNLNSKIEK